MKAAVVGEGGMKVKWRDEDQYGGMKRTEDEMLVQVGY